VTREPTRLDIRTEPEPVAEQNPNRHLSMAEE
jgi:hypothetical protein